MVCFLLRVTEKPDPIDVSHEENRNLEVGPLHRGYFSSSFQQVIKVLGSFPFPVLSSSMDQLGCSQGHKSVTMGLRLMRVSRGKRDTISFRASFYPSKSYLSLARTGLPAHPSASFSAKTSGGLDHAKWS